MQYKAHIPAGIALAATVTLFTGEPLDPLMLIGGAIGGALPDIDVEGADDQGSAVQHLGSKASGAMQATVVLSPLARIMRPIASVFDTIILGPICKGWRFLAKRVLAPAYLAIARSEVGRTLRLDQDNPSAHRGGLTHSLFAMLLFSLVIYPLCNLAHIPQLWLGIMCGMLSHLLCDAVCKSGVKFLWPWVPNIGFRNEDGIGGREGIKLLPAGALMKTGKCTTRAELHRHRGERNYPSLRKYYRLETGWRIFLRILAIVIPILVLLGIGPASGVLKIGDWELDLAGKRVNAATTTMYEQVVPVEEQTAPVTPTTQATPATTTSDVVQGGGQDATAGGAQGYGQGAVPSPAGAQGTQGGSQPVAPGVPLSEAITVDAGRGTRIEEHQGPSSLTYGDISTASLPARVVKMPDESLWVVGVGPVNTESMADPSFAITDEEKLRLIEAANWKRRSSSTGAVIQPGTGLTGYKQAEDGQQQQQQQPQQVGNVTPEIIDPGVLPDGNDLIIIPGQESQYHNEVGDFLNGLFGDGGLFGFHGLTPFTQPNQEG